MPNTGTCSTILMCGAFQRRKRGRPLNELSDPLWLADLAFSFDLADQLNTLNKSPQGKEQIVHQLYTNMKEFCVKFCVFESQLRNFNVAHLSTLYEINCTFPNAKLSDKMGKYVSVITSLNTGFSQPFPDFSVIEKEIKLFAQFLINTEEVEERLQLELIEMQCVDSRKNQHQFIHLPHFYWSSLPHFDWSSKKGRFPLMRRHSKRMTSMLGSIYKHTFSLIPLNRSRLNQNDQQPTVMFCASQPPN